MRKSIAGILFAAAAAIPTATLAITNDWVEDHEHPFVGLVVFYDAKGNFIWRCSGSLLEDGRTFLTAGHCADTAEGAASARVWFQQDAGARFDGKEDPVSGYPNRCAGGENSDPQCTSASRIFNYGFANFAGFPDTHDAGVVILDRKIELREYGQLPKAGMLDHLATARGTNDTVFTVSGYGLSLRVEVHSALSNVSFRERLMGESTLVNLNSSLNDGFNLQTQGNGNGRAGTCSGDSGGPVFLGNARSNLIVAVTSFGLNALCRGTDFAYRIDRKDVLNFIESHRP